MTAAELPCAIVMEAGVAFIAKSGVMIPIGGGGGAGVGVGIGVGDGIVEAKNSPMLGAEAAAPGNDDIPRACAISLSVLWC